MTDQNPKPTHNIGSTAIDDQITFNVESIAVNAPSRRIKTQWSHYNMTVTPGSTIILFLNGKSSSGKGTAIEYFKLYCKANNINFGTTSSIDCIRDLLSDTGFDVSKRTDADRKLLASMGSILEEYNQYRSRYVVEKFEKFLNINLYQGDCLFVVEVREKSVIETIINLIQDRSPGEPSTVYKVFVDNNRVTSVPNNEVDQSVEKDDFYDLVLENNGTYGEFLDKTFALLDDVFAMEKLKENT